MRISMFLACALTLAPLSALAESFPDVEYTSGHAGLDHKVKGTLTIDDQSVSFQDKNGTAVFTLPIKTVTSASSSVNHDEGSFGRKVALGIFASKTEEFLTIHTEGPQGAEALMLKCKKHTSQGIADKIQYQAKRAADASTH